MEGNVRCKLDLSSWVLCVQARIGDPVFGSNPSICEGSVTKRKSAF